MADFGELEESKCGPPRTAHDAVGFSAAPVVQEAIGARGEHVTVS